jgi:DNA-binding LacI/PurR family transcriptional regulator
MRERVEAAIAELDYRPSQLARSLSKGSSDTVSVVAPHITRPSVVARIDSCLAELNRVGVVASLFGVFNRTQFDQVVDALSDRHSTRALVVVSIPVTGAQVSALQCANVSLIGLDVKVTTSDSVFIDNVLGGAMVGSHLIAQGYRRIGFVGDVDSGNFKFTSSHARLRGLKSALQKGGLRLEPENVKFCEHGTSSAKECAMGLLMSNRAPDAIFASSDTGALGVLSAATELGLRVPDDLGVVGFDDLEMAEVVGLSSVSQPLSLSGAIVAERLIKRLTRQDAHPIHTLLDLHLVKRASSSKACHLANVLQPAN